MLPFWIAVGNIGSVLIPQGPVEETPFVNWL